MSGGLDSQLAVRILESAGAEVEAVCFSSPFFDTSIAEATAAKLGVKLRMVDFTDDILGLIQGPAHGFGGAMNPCIDCHAAMIARAGRLMEELGYDFVATGEVQGQRPMSQNKQALGVVAKTSGLAGRLVRPLSAKLLEPTVPELEGKLDREKLYDISGRGRERQIELAARFGIVDYPSPAGGCKLTEEGFSRKLRDLMDHEGLGERFLVELLSTARRFRLPDGTGVVLGRDRGENLRLRELAGRVEKMIAPVNVPGPTALLPKVESDSDLNLAAELVAAYSKYDRLEGDIVLNIGAVGRPYDREKFKRYQIC
jgi:tRNA U34 2-thiouridine synthase MnmA/TrmU